MSSGIVDLDRLPGRTIRFEDRDHLYFGGTSYLGLGAHNGFQKLLLDNIQTFGFNHGASRKSNVRLRIYDRAEAHLAKITGAENCLTLSSGFLAGQLVQSFFASVEYARFYLDHAHPAILPPAVQTVSITVLGEILQRHFATSNPAVPVVFFDSISFMENESGEFEWLQQLPLEQIILVADDSHALGIMGQKGQGYYQQLKAFNPKKLIVCGSLGKGFGIPAGMVASDAKTINNMADNFIFVGASPASPAGMATFFKAADFYHEQLKKLDANRLLFEKSVKNLSFFRGTNGHPTYSFMEEVLVRVLRDNGIITTHFGYPDTNGPKVGRIVLSAHHSEEDVRCLVEVLNGYFDFNKRV